MTDASSPARANRTAVLATVAAVLIVVVGLAYVQTRGDDGPPSTGSATGAPEPAAELPPPGECTEPPPLPSDPPQLEDAPDPGLAEDTVWTARVATSCGEIVLELYGDRAPQTVASFLSLAEAGYWDDSPCHRLVPQGIFVLQCGDPTGTGSGGPGYGYGVENAPPDGQYPRGTLAMARTADPNSNGGQFFVVFDDTELPDPVGYSIFGTVVEGMDVVDRVAGAGVGDTLGPEAPRQPISILDVTVAKRS